MPIDEKGYFDRRCPHPECGAGFKVIFDDWRDKVPNEAAFCPKCGERNEPSNFNTPAQAEFIQETAMAYATQQVQGALSRAVQQTRPQRLNGGLLSIEMTLSYSPNHVPAPLPIEAQTVLRQDLQCDGCGCRYATIGAGYFCPACGVNSATRDFERCAGTTLKTLDALDDIRSTMAAKYDVDVADDFVQQTLEDQIENLVTASQRVTEALFHKLPNAPTFKCDTNLFQRLNDASQLWQQATGRDYATFLSQTELSDLATMLQRRHKFGHSQGMVDQRYVDKSGDRSYAVGQRLVISVQNVQRLAALITKLVGGLRDLVIASGGKV
jgi:hypothetical protein